MCINICRKDAEEVVPIHKFTFLWHLCAPACCFVRCQQQSWASVLHTLAAAGSCTLLGLRCACVSDWFSTHLHSHACWVRLFSLSAEPALPSAPLRLCLSHFCWSLRLCVCTYSFLFRPTVLGVLGCIWLNRNWISWQRGRKHSMNQHPRSVTHAEKKLTTWPVCSFK